MDDLEKLIFGYIDRIGTQFSERIRRRTPDLFQNEVSEVVEALLSRQITLAIQIAQNPGIWNGHSAPIFLRTMADTHISMAWVIGDAGPRSRLFIEYGLGQQKLELEHRRAQLEEREPKEGELEFLLSIEKWISAQRLHYLVEVNIGSWSGKSTRKMAEEAGIQDFYNYVYTPFSACVHSMWHHVSRYNLEKCQNPLHRFHLVGALRNAPFDVNYFYLAAKYSAKTLVTFDDFAHIEAELPSAYDWLEQELSSWGEVSQPG